MSAKDRTEVVALTAQMREMWGYLSQLFDRLDAKSGWGQKHGRDWTLADVPYHLAYCNQDLVVKGIELGEDYPEAERQLFLSAGDVGAWNARKFDERPDGQTAAESVAQWRDSIEAIDRLLVRMGDADLDSRCWFPLFQGWAPARHLLMFALTHDWSEYTQLRLYMGVSGPLPNPATTRAYLSAVMGFFPMRLNADAADGGSFSTVMAFTDPEVGAWTIKVENGAAAVENGAVENPDLILTQSAETFEKTVRGMQDPGEAIRSGLVQVSDFHNLARFGRLFPS